MLVSFLLIVIWILLTLKTTRPDGILVDYVHPYRKMLLYIMLTKAESVVLFDEAVPADNLLEYIQTTRERFKADMDVYLRALKDTGYTLKELQGPDAVAGKLRGGVCKF